jgi:FkbM family methyltransferase
MLQGIKYAVAESVKRNPWTWHIVWNAMPLTPLLLPHDKSYYGFLHLAGAGDGLFLDIGANNGITSAGFRKLNSRYRILAIEASVIHAPALARLKRREQAFDYIVTGVGRAPGSFQLFTPIYRGMPIHTHSSSSRPYMDVALRRDFSTAVVDRMTMDEQTVRIIEIDSLGLSPDIVKIDIEGADFEALQGMTKTIRRCRPAVMFEFTPGKSDGIAPFFLERGYRLLVFDDVANRFFPFDAALQAKKWSLSRLQVNVFAVPSEREVPERVAIM